MKTFSWFAINEDVEAEFRYWLAEFQAALGMALVFTVATSLLIAVLPRTGAASNFANDFWPALIECAFWLGLFIGLAWGAGKRLGASLAGSLPWQALPERQHTGRLFGQWAAFAALVGFFLWFTQQAALAAGDTGMIAFSNSLAPLGTACYFATAIFALVALACRRKVLHRKAPHSREGPEHAP